MTLARSGDLVAAAARAGGAVPAFNVVTLEQAEAVVSGATDAGTAVIVQISQNAAAFHGGFAPLAAAVRELAEAAVVDVAVHLDHLDDPELARRVLARAATLGIGSLMFDASTLDDAANTALTAIVAREAHAAGLWIEGELGEVGGKNGAHTPGARTDPDDAVRFVAATGVDGLAVAVGSSHAMRERTASLDLDLIARLAAAVPVPLVLHGSSGVPDAVLAEAVAAGIRKVNIGTALGVAGTTALRRELADRPDAVDVRTYLAGMRAATAAEVAHLATVVAG